MPTFYLHLEYASLQYLEIFSAKVLLWTERFHVPESTLAFALARLFVLRQKDWVQKTSEPVLCF
jgi:hypothetical protein